MDEQLPLPMAGAEADTEPTLPSRLAFPVVTDGGVPFDDKERFFEPWWPGAQAFLRRAGRHVEMRTQLIGDPLAALPELRGCIEALAADGVIIEGTLLALDAEGRPDAALLRRRLTEASRPTEIDDGAFVASDLVYADGRSLSRLPFVQRRERLASALSETDRCVLSRGLVGEGVTLGRAVASMGLHAISARRLDGRWHSGPAGDDWLRLRVDEAPALPTRPFLVLLEMLPLGE